MGPQFTRLSGCVGWVIGEITQGWMISFRFQGPSYTARLWEHTASGWQEPSGCSCAGRSPAERVCSWHFAVEDASFLCWARSGPALSRRTERRLSLLPVPQQSIWLRT